MIKFTDFDVVFEEIPDRVTLALSISNCQNNCKGCHSAYLRKNVGTVLTRSLIKEMFDTQLKYCNCFLLLGEGDDRETLINLSDYVKKEYGIETAIYSGRDEVEDDYFDHFDFVKVGSWQSEKGPLNKETTNQRLYYHGEDITYKFWKNKKVD